MRQPSEPLMAVLQYALAFVQLYVVLVTGAQISPPCATYPVGYPVTSSTESEEVNPLLLALMLVEPGETVVTRPVPLIVATAVLLEAQVVVPKVAAVPSVMMPLAVNCS
jgi:hypothetical protein